MVEEYIGYQGECPPSYLDNDSLTYYTNNKEEAEDGIPQSNSRQV